MTSLGQWCWQSLLQTLKIPLHRERYDMLQAMLLESRLIVFLNQSSTKRYRL